MGGLECTVDAECIDKTGKVIPGLYVAGEAAGGIHGNNRLGGNSLFLAGTANYYIPMQRLRSCCRFWKSNLDTLFGN